MNKIIYIIACLFVSLTALAAGNELDFSEKKKVRNYIKSGNVEYENKNYNKAIEYYNRALEIDPENPYTLYNYANAVVAKSSQPVADENKAQLDSLLKQAIGTYQALYDDKNVPENLREKSAYNQGNYFFRQEDYKNSITAYRNALRINPDNDKARENLYLALRKMKDDNGGGGSDDQQQNQDRNEDQNQQNENQNQDQNNQDQNQNNQQQQQPLQQQPNEVNKENQSLSRENAERALKAAEVKEKQTREKLDKKDKKVNAAVRASDKPW